MRLFWQWAEDQARAGAVVLVSEYTAPAGWVGIWSRQLNGSLHSHTNTFPVLEKLFAHEMMAQQYGQPQRNPAHPREVGFLLCRIGLPCMLYS